MTGTEAVGTFLPKEEISRLMENKDVKQLVPYGGIHGIMQKIETSEDGLDPANLKTEQRTALFDIFFLFDCVSFSLHSGHIVMAETNLRNPKQSPSVAFGVSPSLT
jgi:hypothetical protein